ncbi:MAG: VCBS repeat-containing protein [Candidatus Omnitrophica bacterium]|nr:VCBS repeat-containing protein [Candidatus Omnitrophota bacterium]
MSFFAMKRVLGALIVCSLLTAGSAFAAAPAIPTQAVSEKKGSLLTTTKIAKPQARLAPQPRVETLVKEKSVLNDLQRGPKVPEVATPEKAPVLALSSAQDSSGGSASSGTQNFAKTLSVDSRSGSSAVEIPLFIPESRGGLAPFMRLFYSSTNGNGQFGWGWRMDLGSVVMSPKNMIPYYNGNEPVIATLGGVNYELINIGSNEYRSKYDNDRLRFFLNSGVWSAKDKNGTTYYFGSRAGSTVNENGTNIYKWKLDRVEDLFGNVLVVDYAANGSFEVRYGLMSGKSITTDVNNPANFAYMINVDVQLSDRPDVYTDYKPGYGVSERRLVSTITVKGGGNLLKKYSFDYALSARTSRSLLKNVTETGADNLTTQPVVNLQYNDTQAPTYAVRTVSGPLPGNNAYGFSTGDFNGDGRSDLGAFMPATGTASISLMDTNASFLPRSDWTTYFSTNQSLMFADFDGDGRTDILAYDLMNKLWSGGLWIALSNGSTFTSTANWRTVTKKLPELYTGDFDGDTCPDILQVGPFTDNWCFYVLRGSCNGHSFGTGSYRYFDPGVQLGPKSATLIPADYNGDGITDLMTFNQGTGTWIVQIVTKDLTKARRYSIAGFGTNYYPVVADLNQDGRADIGYFDPLNKNVIYRPSIDGGFGSQQTLSLNLSLTGVSTALQVGDFNGDGVPDFLAYDTTGRQEVALSGGTKFADLLTSYDNGFGGLAAMTYASSSDFTTNNYLPSPLPVVTGVTVSNSQGDAVTTTYSYSGGYWSKSDRELYGFKEVRVIDADGNYVVSQFNQDDLYMRGHLDRTALYDKNGVLYQETKYQWNNTPVIPGRTDIRFVGLKRTDNFVYDTASAMPVNVRTAQEYAYDLALGIPTEVRDYGQVDWTTGADTGSDYIRTAMTYGSNTANNVLGVLTSKISYDGSNNVLAKSYAYYDSSTTPGVVTKGLVTRSDVWNKVNGVESLITSTNVYNDYGQLLTTTDPLNNKTSVSYDPTWSMFPLTTVNAKNFRKTSTYYGVNGVPLAGGIWGLTQSVTDPNSRTSTITYDALGRVTAEINPLDSADYPTTTYEYITKTNYRVMIAHNRIEHGQSATLDSYVYIDGLGRTLSVKTPSATTGKVVVSGQVTSNNRGLVVKEYPAYFSTSDYSVLELPGTANAATTFEYDALGRRIKAVFADGTYAATVFSPLSTTVTDPNGHRTIRITDARGRIIRVENYSGATGQSDMYPAQAFTLYAATTYNYDLLGNLLTVTDSKNNVTTMTYDALGRKLSMDDPDMHHVSYEYDVPGKLIKQTDAMNVSMAITYDVLGRPLSKARADSGADKVSYMYDQLGQNILRQDKGKLVNVDYPSGRTGFEYDLLGQERLSTKVIGNSIYHVLRSYDALGRLKSLSYDGKALILYTYNAAGQLNAMALQLIEAGVLSVQSIITNIEYAANGSIKKITYGNGAVAAYVYDPLTQRLSTFALVDKNSVAVQYNGYLYDPAGNIVCVEDKIKETSRRYTYDALNRMVTSQDGAEVLIAYQYDELGNIKQKGALTYTYGENGAGPHAVTSISDGTLMTYDANGNMSTYRTTAKTRNYIYDMYNRLIRVEEVNARTAARVTVAEYGYDGDGGRTRKTVYTNINGTVGATTTHYVGDLIEKSGSLMRMAIM